MLKGLASDQNQLPPPQVELEVAQKIAKKIHEKAVIAAANEFSGGNDTYHLAYRATISQENFAGWCQSKLSSAAPFLNGPDEVQDAFLNKIAECLYREPPLPKGRHFIGVAIGATHQRYSRGDVFLYQYKPIQFKLNDIAGINPLADAAAASAETR